MRKVVPALLAGIFALVPSTRAWAQTATPVQNECRESHGGQGVWREACRGEADCDEKLRRHNEQWHSGGSGDTEEDSFGFNPLLFPALAGTLGWSVGRELVSTTTNKPMGLPGLYSGVAFGGLLVSTVNKGMSAPARVIISTGSGAAAGKALSEYNKAQDKEPKEALNVGAGAAAGAAWGVGMHFVNENAQPDWLRRRLGPRARIHPIANPGFIGVLLTW